MGKNAVALFVPDAWTVIDGGSEGGPPTESVRDFRLLNGEGKKMPPRPRSEGSGPAPLTRKAENTPQRSIDERLSSIETEIRAMRKSIDRLIKVLESR